MRDYFIRRILLIPPTLLGVTLLVFLITRAVPGGPLERALMEARQLDASSGRGGSMAGRGMAISDEQIEQLKKYYGFDKPPLVSYFLWLGKLVSGDLGRSYRYNESVTSLIRQRIPVSLFYGVVTLVLTYGISVPLGIVKAIRHRTLIDNFTSVIVFVGYSIPGYALGALLLLFFSARLGWFPMGGFVSYNFADMSFSEQIGDLISHAVLPLVCYLVTSFAITTLLMKNHLMDNLAADYIRTAVAKGVSFRGAVIRHALRNSLIPIATTFGQNITLLVSGSFLIETIFDINGFGLLGINSILDRDYPIVMGVVLIGALLLMIGNVLSDFLVALIDPRIRFH